MGVNEINMKMKKRAPFCPVCSDKKFLLYIEEVDAYACRKCNLWLEKKCNEEDCLFCPYRKEKPSLHPEFHGKSYRS